MNEAINKHPIKSQKGVTIIASGGGHTAYAIALAEELKGKVTLSIVIPKGDRWTKERMEGYGIIFETEKANPGSKLWKRILATIRGFLQGLQLPKADVVVATGSNHSIGPALALKLRGAKLVVIEAIDRTVTKSRAINILSKFADITALHWDIQKSNYPNGVVCGPILPKKNNSASNKTPHNYVLISFGTTGFKEFFDFVTKNGRQVIDKKIVLQTGKIPANTYIKRGFYAFQFDKNFGKWISDAEVIITHQGATAAEAAITYGKPVVIVFNHNLKNTSGKEDTKTLASIISAVFVEDYKKFSKEHTKDAIFLATKRKEFKNGAKTLAEKIFQIMGIQNGE